VWILIFGTVVAMVPPMTASAVPQAQRVRPITVELSPQSEPVEAGD
jgi:hypothetical protein